MRKVITILLLLLCLAGCQTTVRHVISPAASPSPSATLTPAPPVVDSMNVLLTSNRADLAFCVQVEDPAEKDAQAAFREAVQQVLDTRLSQLPDWKKIYGAFAYRVDAGCPSGPHRTEIVTVPSLYRFHLYVVDADTARQIPEAFGARQQPYELLGSARSNDSFFEVTTALYLTSTELRSPDLLAGQLSAALSLGQ